MDAEPRLVEIADAFAEAKLEAILIGNAGAALHGAPVTTMEFEFVYAGGPDSRAKLNWVAELLGAQIEQPFAERSEIFRILCRNSHLQIDLKTPPFGVTFGDLRSGAVQVEVGGRCIWVASKRDADLMQKHLSASKESSKRKRTRKPTQREIALEAMRQGSEQELTEMIRRQLALPMNKRTHFLRMRLPNGGSCL